MRKTIRFLCMALVCVITTSLLSLGASAAHIAMPVLAETNAKLKGLNPYVYLSSYEIIDGVIEGGETFTLRAHITNANTQTNAYNLMMTLFFPVSDGIYIPEGDTNQHYFAVLSAGETITVDIPFLIDGNLVQPAMVVEFDFEYVNDNRVPYANTSVITLLRHKSSDLTVGLVNLPAAVAAEGQAPVNIQCSNTGKSALFNIVATLEGDFAGSPMDFEKEKLEAGERFIVDTNLVFSQQGSSNLRVRASYETANGNQFKTDTQAYEINVAGGELEQPIPYQNNSVSPSANNIFAANSFWFYITLASGVLLLGVIIALAINMLRGRKKRK